MSHAIETFFAAWGMEDADARAQAIESCCANPLTYLDPRTPDPISDRDDLSGYVAMYTQFAPGAQARAAVVSTTGAHHRATVVFEMSDGKQQLGQYFIEMDSTGKIARMIGFAGLGAPE